DQNAVQTLYIAYFGRPAAPAGLAYWLSNGQSLDQVGSYFSHSPELIAQIPGLNPNALTQSTASALVTNFYANLFGRQPLPAGLTYWTNELLSGAITVNNLGTTLVANASSGDSATIANKVAVANYFTAQVTAQNAANAYSGNAAHATVRTMLDGITATTPPATYDSTVSSVISSLPTNTTGVDYPLLSAYQSFRQQGSSYTFTSSGSCSGTGTIIDSPASTTSSFNGVSGYSASETFSDSFANCTSLSATYSLTRYFDQNYLPLGYNVQSGVYAVFQTPAQIPANVSVGSTGTVGTLTLYADSSKSTIIGTETYSYSVQSGAVGSSTINVIFTSSIYNTGAALTSVDQDTYQLTTGGTMTLVSSDVQYFGGSTTNMTWTYSSNNGGSGGSSGGSMGGDGTAITLTNPNVTDAHQCLSYTSDQYGYAAIANSCTYIVSGAYCITNVTGNFPVPDCSANGTYDGYNVLNSGQFYANPGQVASLTNGIGGGLRYGNGNIYYFGCGFAGTTLTSAAPILISINPTTGICFDDAAR
ncbi:MAG: DUF4214 domain-containing protein, partial [Burkholderiales bacterium]